MRVGILTDAFPPTVGGMEIFAGRYIRKLAAHPAVNHVDVLAFQAGKEMQSENLSIERSTESGSLSRWKTGITWAARGQYDVVHSLTLYPCGVVAALANTLGFTDRSFVTVYGTDALGAVDDPLHCWLRQTVFRNVSEVLFFSDSTRERTHEAYDLPFASRTIYPGQPELPPPDESFTQPDTSGAFTLLTVCRLVERKGVDDLIAAIEPLSDVELFIVGDGPERPSLEQQVRERNLEDRVAFIGEIAHGEVVNYYDRADLFAMPSRHLERAGDIEGLGLVFLEAQQLGLPVVGTESGGIPEALDDGSSGFLVEEGNPDAIRERIERLRDSDRYETFSQNAKRFVEERFSWDSCVSAHIESYTNGFG